ncbi:MAG TPA: LpqN/LpqT family lipoprotein [Nocardioides sp.]|nr:LpqN/LpqT family lipoprotein [Nocardioides sp.]
MNHPARFAAPAVLLLALAIAACGGEDPDRGPRSSDGPSVIPDVTPTATATETGTDATTILEYFEQAGITQTALGPDDGGPVVDLPVLDGWSESGDYASEASYGAIVYDAAADATQPPRVLTLLARVEGPADPARILELAPGELLGLDGFTPSDDGEASTLGAYDAVQVIGSYSNGGHDLLIAQKTVVVPDGDELYVLQLNAYAPPAEADVLLPALQEIDATTTITP